MTVRCNACGRDNEISQQLSSRYQVTELRCGACKTTLSREWIIASSELQLTEQDMKMLTGMKIGWK